MRSKHIPWFYGREKQHGPKWVRYGDGRGRDQISSLVRTIRCGHSNALIEPTPVPYVYIKGAATQYETVMWGAVGRFSCGIRDRGPYRKARISYRYRMKISQCRLRSRSHFTRA